MMSGTKKKETTLSIQFVNNDDSDGNMSKLMKLLGAPDFESELVDRGWDITAPDGKELHVSSSSIMEFIRDSVPDVVVEKAIRDEYKFSSFANKDFIENTYFGTDDNCRIYSHIGYLWSEIIQIITTGNGATKPALDRFHRKNVLAVKDKIVAMENVHNVEYTCTLKNIVESECSV